MSSEQRSNSAVRNLRSLFENKVPISPDPRGRSPGSVGDCDSQRPRSKIRASFVPVQPAMASLPAEQDGGDLDLKKTSSAGLRRASFSESHDSEAMEAAREVVNAEQERRANESSVAEAIPEAAVETPAFELNRTLGDSSKLPVDKEAMNPDKPSTGAEEEPGSMRPANPANEAAVSGGDALPPTPEDLRKTIKPSSSKPKPTSISTRGTPKASTSVKSPASQPRTPVSATSTQKAPTKKASRSSLTAPTAASVARAAQTDRPPLPTSKPRSKEATKPVEISSRLTAPTAATRARLESSTSTANTKPVATASRSKAHPSVKPTPRSSLARPDSRLSESTNKRPAAPVDGSFLDRMMRPTAASANKTHEKSEAKTPPKKQVPSRPKANGVPKGPSKVSSSAEAGVDSIPESAALEATQDENTSSTAVNQISNETPIQVNGYHEDTATSV